jgi:glycosyltransferase involved in cell wall biosynthesis
MDLNLGYFCHSNFATSETFIYDLVKTLNADNDINLTYITGKKVPLKTDFEVKNITAGYSEKYLSWAFRIYKIGQMFGKGAQLKMRFQKWVAFRSIKHSRLPKFDVAYVDYATSAVLLMDYFEANKIPFIVHVHGYDVTTCLNDKEYVKQLNILFEKAAYIISPSNHLKRVLTISGCNPSKIKSIYPVTNLENINVPSWNERIKLSPSVTFIGRLTDKKNPLALVYAFQIVAKILPNVQLNILGDGPLMADLKQCINRLNLSNKISLFGVVNREVAFNHLRNTWIYAQHSVTSFNGDQEGFPVSLAEAAAYALPLVSTIHSGITENVIDGKTGFLVQEYDYETMAEKIIYLIQHPDIAEQMGKAGREHIMKLCESGKRVKQIRKLLFDLTDLYITLIFYLVIN